MHVGLQFLCGCVAVAICRGMWAQGSERWEWRIVTRGTTLVSVCENPGAKFWQPLQKEGLEINHILFCVTHWPHIWICMSHLLVIKYLPFSKRAVSYTLSQVELFYWYKLVFILFIAHYCVENEVYFWDFACWIDYFNIICHGNWGLGWSSG
jgi:hypothetical protein